MASEKVLLALLAVLIAAKILDIGHNSDKSRAKKDRQKVLRETKKLERDLKEAINSSMLPQPGEIRSRHIEKAIAKAVPNIYKSDPKKARELSRDIAKKFTPKNLARIQSPKDVKRFLA